MKNKDGNMDENRDDKKEDVLLCRCEEVTREEILLAVRSGCHTVSSVKRTTRAGMGACQGRTCGRLIQQILLSEGLCGTETISADKARFPVVPCSIESLGGIRDGETV